MCALISVYFILQKLEEKGPKISRAVGFGGFGGSSGGQAAGGRPPGKRKLSAMEEIMEQEKKKKETSASSARTEWWLQTGIVVKVVNKKLKDGKYHKQKGVVQVRSGRAKCSSRTPLQCNITSVSSAVFYAGRERAFHWGGEDAGYQARVSLQPCWR